MNTQNHQPKIWLAMLLVAVLSAAGGYSAWQLTQVRPEAATEALLKLPKPRVIADFALIDHEGEPFSLGDLQGRWSLLFFGFTHCPDVCPGALYDLDQLEQKLDRSERDLPTRQVVFFSVDPERDSPEQLKKYTTYFNPDFKGVTGDHAQLLPLTRQLGIAYRVDDHEAGQLAYQVDHSASILLMNPEGRLHGVFPAPQNVDAMYRDLLKVLN